MGGVGNTGGGPEEPLPFNSCSEFVNFLADLVRQYAGHLNDDSAPDEPSVAASRLGSKMMSLAFFGYARHANNKAEGFKPKLTNPGGQGGGVYGHILGFAGAYQDFLFGEVAGYANEIDEFQLLRGDKQGPAEVAGNRAGWAVGRHIWNFISGRTPRETRRLKNSITAELCQ